MAAEHAALREKLALQADRTTPLRQGKRSRRKLFPLGREPLAPLQDGFEPLQDHGAEVARRSAVRVKMRRAVRDARRLHALR